MKARIGDDFPLEKSEEFPPLLKAYIQMLSNHQWTLYFNASFRKPVKQEAAKKIFRGFVKNLNSEELRMFKGFVRCWIFYENKGTDRVHIHALIDRINTTCAGLIEKKGIKTFGEWSVVRPYEPEFEPYGAKMYLAKKIGTEALDHYEFLVISSRVR